MICSVGFQTALQEACTRFGWIGYSVREERFEWAIWADWLYAARAVVWPVPSTESCNLASPVVYTHPPFQVDPKAQGCWYTYCFTERPQYLRCWPKHQERVEFIRCIAIPWSWCSLRITGGFSGMHHECVDIRLKHWRGLPMSSICHLGFENSC